MSTAFLGCLISHLFFQLALPAILPLSHSRWGAPAEQNRSEHCQGASCSAHRSRAPSWRPALQGKAQEHVCAPEQALDSQTEECAHVCAETRSWQPLPPDKRRESGTADPPARSSSFVPCPERSSPPRAIVCYLSPWHLAASLDNFSYVHFIIPICNCILR